MIHSWKSVLRCYQFYSSASESADETVITKEYDNKDGVDAALRGKSGNIQVKTRTTVSRGDITASEGEAYSQPETVGQTKLV